MTTAQPLLPQPESMYGSSNAPDIVFAFDTTGSMYPYLAAVRSRLLTLIDILRAEVPGIRLGFIAFGDHCDEGKPYLLKICPLTSDLDEVQRFVAAVQPTGGGDLPEAVEDVLHAASASFDWRAASPKALVLVGDAPPHEPHDCPNGYDWRCEAQQLAARGVQMYTVQCGTFRATRRVWQWLANETCGCYLPLSLASDLSGLLLAICLQQAQRLDESGMCDLPAFASAQLRHLIAVLRGEAVDETLLQPVPQGAYRKLTAANEAQIRDMVQAAGLPYSRGSAYYQVQKDDLLRGSEPFMLEEIGSGQIYAGQAVIDLMQPDAAPLRGIVYVQSKSPKRRVCPGESILYRLPAA